MKLITKNRTASLFTLAALAAGSYASAARATVFENKWIAGQRLSYDMTLSDSRLSLAGSRNAPMLPMGIPLTIDLSGKGAIDLDTQSVADDGTGIVAVRVPTLQINGSVMTFNVAIKMKDGKGQFLMNGKSMGDAAGFDVSAMTSPPVALKIGKGGDVLGFVPLAGAALAPAKPDKKSPFPIDFQSMMQSAMGNVMPQLWPARDLKDGESWSIEPTVALPGKDAAKLGTVNLKLIGAEKIDGRDVQHVTVQGELNINKEMAAEMAKARPAALAAASPGAIDRVKQVINGDIWFDAAAGQMVRTVMKVHLQSEGSGAAKSRLDDDDAAPKPWTSTQEFEGTVNLNLRGVSTAPVLATTAPVVKVPAVDAKPAADVAPKK